LLNRIARVGLTVLLLVGVAFGATPAPAAAAPPTLTADTLVSGLAYPWDIAFAPNGQMMVTLRGGQVKVYSGGHKNPTLLRTVTIPSVGGFGGEAGLMGIAVDTDFASNGFVYVCATRSYNGSTKNEVIRYRVTGSGAWVEARVIVGGMAAESTHNGCALEMDRFGYLWVTMGDAEVPSRAQSLTSLNGKVLRVNRDGSAPSTNPFVGKPGDDRIYSLGHRNPQGIAFQPGTDRVYAVEHGPNTDDEVNLLAPGGNYGWPCVTGTDDPYNGCSGQYRDAKWESNTPTLAASGATFVSGAQWGDYNGNLWVSTLKWGDPSPGHKMLRFGVAADGNLVGPGDPAAGNCGNPCAASHYDETFGRIRAAVSGPGGQLYISTSNGSNDKIVRISPRIPSVTRTFGNNRNGTAAAISQAEFPTLTSDVMVATGANWPDALAGSAAAGRFGMPILLVGRDAIPPETRNEINRRNPVKIWVLGGPSAVSEAVRADLAQYATSGQVERVSGADRYGTAVAISQRWYAPGVQAAFIATGTNFPDALAGGPAAALRDSPLLLVKPGDIPDSTAAELDRLNPQRIYILGGTGVVSQAVAAELDTYTNGQVTRLAGANRYATAAAVTKHFWGRVSTVYVATGEAFPDALGGAAAAGRASMPLLLSAENSVPWPTGQELLRMGPTRVKMLGGTSALTPAVEARLKALVGTP
jgi:glucose/arabinose dehydrogenase/putative cell wall-binding protein